jgi:hypothetical protein
LVGGCVFGGQGVGIPLVTSRGYLLEFDRGRSVGQFGPYLTGLVFPILGHFCTFWPISTIFDPHFSSFCLFSDLVTRETNATESRTYYSPSPTRVKAPQLGPRGVVFVHGVDLGLNHWFPLVQWGSRGQMSTLNPGDGLPGNLCVQC